MSKFTLDQICSSDKHPKKIATSWVTWCYWPQVTSHIKLHIQECSEEMSLCNPAAHLMYLSNENSNSWKFWRLSIGGNIFYNSNILDQMEEAEPYNMHYYIIEAGVYWLYHQSWNLELASLLEQWTVLKSNLLSMFSRWPQKFRYGNENWWP